MSACIHDAWKWLDECLSVGLTAVAAGLDGSLIELRVPKWKGHFLSHSSSLLSLICSANTHTHGRNHINLSTRTYCMHTLQQLTHTACCSVKPIDVFSAAHLEPALYDRQRMSVTLTDDRSASQLLHWVWFISQAGFNIRTKKSVSIIPPRTLLVERFTGITESSPLLFWNVPFRLHWYNNLILRCC